MVSKERESISMRKEAGKRAGDISLFSTVTFFPPADDNR
jgi:hypothetical protein